MPRDLSIFADESGGRRGHSKYYLLTLVFHDQGNDILESVGMCEDALRRADPPNIPFHSGPLLNSRGAYENLDIAVRKKLLHSFAAMVRYFPISCRTFAYRRSEYEDPTALSTRTKRDISGLLFDNPELFQSFDEVKVYYDNGQDVVKQALDQSIGCVLSKSAVQRRRTSMTDYQPEQVADCPCTIELAAIKYAAEEDGGTYDKYFGSIGAFKKNWLKQARRKRM